MPSHPAFRKFTLPNSPILRDQKQKDVSFAVLPNNGHRKNITTVQTIKFATGQPGYHTWYRKRVQVIELVTYSIYGGDHDELTTDSETTNFHTGDTTTDDDSDGDFQPRSLSPSSISSFPSEHDSDDEVSAVDTVHDDQSTSAAVGALQPQPAALTVEEVRAMHARIYADADKWAASALQAISLSTSAAPPSTANTAAGSAARPLGSSPSTAIVLSDSEGQNDASGTSTRGSIKRGVTLMGEVAGPPSKKAKTASVSAAQPKAI